MNDRKRLRPAARRRFEVKIVLIAFVAIMVLAWIAVSALMVFEIQ